MELENLKNQDIVNPIVLKTIASKLFHLKTKKKTIALKTIKSRN